MDLPQPKRTPHPPTNSSNQWKDHQRMLFNTAYGHNDMVTSYGFSSPRINSWDSNSGPFMQSDISNHMRIDVGLVYDDIETMEPCSLDEPLSDTLQQTNKT